MKTYSWFVAAMVLGVTPGCVIDSSTPGGTLTLGNNYRPYTTVPAADETPTGTDWGSNAIAYRGRLTLHVLYNCPANGTGGTVWGTDVYTDDSSVCTAGVHAGRITVRGGGPVVIEIRAGQVSYQPSTRNGITTTDYGNWSGSFVVL